MNNGLAIAPSIKALTNRVPAFLRDVRFAAALASLVLSVWCVFLDDVINNDGILYVRTAELIGRGEWQAAIGTYKWFFYPLLMAVVSKLTGLGLELSAHVLNAGFTALTVVAFISLARELGGSRSVVMAAAILVLLYPGLNEYRSFVVRDAGYIAFYTLALLLFVRNLKAPTWRLTTGWIVTMVVATLFRIEGIAFLLTLGIMQQFGGTGPRAKIKTAASIALASVVLFAAAVWWEFGSFSAPGFSVVTDAAQMSWQNFAARFSTNTRAIAEVAQDRYVADYAPVILIVAVAVIVVVRTLDALTPVYTLLTGHAVYQRLAFPLKEAKSAWLGLVIVHVVVLSAIALVRFIFPGRFPVALSLTLMLAGPFSVAALYEQWRARCGQGVRKNWLFPVVCVALLVTGVEGLYSPTNKSHLKRAGVWLKENVPAQARLVSNSPVLLFYAQGPAYLKTESVLDWSQMEEFLKTEKWYGYNYLALHAKRRNEQQAAEVWRAFGDPIASFSNEKGDTVWIYDLRHSS